MVIRDCIKKNREGDPNYTCLNASIKVHVKRLVGSVYWKKAENYLCEYLKRKFLKEQPSLSDKEATAKARKLAMETAAPRSTPFQPGQINELQSMLNSLRL